MRVVFMGTPDFAVPSLQALLRAGHEVAGVFTQPDRPKGRGGKVQMSPVKALALDNGLSVYQPEKLRRDGIDDLRALRPELCVTAAFGQILNDEALAVPRMGTVNVHASLLPRHRGAAPVQWAILQGDAETGVTTMLTDRGIDTGDTLLRRALPISPEDTAGSLLAKLADAGAALLVETIDRLVSGDCPREKQNEAEASYDPMLTKEAGLLRFDEGARRCLLRVRAMDPWPCAYAPLREGALKVWAAREAEGRGEPGAVLRADQQSGLVVATADGAMEFVQIQAPNAKRMDARAFLLGHRIPVGSKLTEVTL